MAKVETQNRGKIVYTFYDYFRPINLTGVAALYPGHLAMKDLLVAEIVMQYVTVAAIAGDATGVTLRLGTHDEPTRFAVWNTAASASVFTVVEIPVSANKTLASGKSLVLRVNSGKSKAGTINVQVKLVENR